MRSEIKQPASLRTTILTLLLFSIAMGYLETSVVVYLRTMFYGSNPFPFPLPAIDTGIAVVEFWREIATLLMLAGAGIIAGKNALQRFAYFLFCFAVWDIFYYIFLKLLIGWPLTLVDWDILFLVPVPWTGPVLAPCIVALTMIVFSLWIVALENTGVKVKVKRGQWMIMLAGCLVILYSFMHDYAMHVLSQPGSGFWTLWSADSLFSEGKDYRPQQFSWAIFLSGELILAAGIARMAYSNKLRTTTNISNPHSI